MTEPSYDECLVEAELRARAAYSELQRCYHDQRHLDECLGELDWVQGLDANDRRLLRWSILWHDAVYEPGHRDNEKRSAELAARELSSCGVDSKDVAEVRRLILATEKHDSDSSDRLGALMVSIDLAILGSDPDRYREYAADVRREYAHVPDPLWRSGRILVLQRLLGSDPIYPDADFRRRLETRARANMEAEVAGLADQMPSTSGRH
jgi:predicted metal-dependent HD superfamily phosphohydrolase